MIPNIAILITCHNRKDKTLYCLQSLFNQNDLGQNFRIEVFLVNDGCIDGTADAIGLVFPQVKVIQGNGNLYWNRGMHLAWDSAATDKDFDYFLWLNDDTFLFENALNIIFQDSFPDSIVCGSTLGQKDQGTTYGGFNKKV